MCDSPEQKAYGKNRKIPTPSAGVEQDGRAHILTILNDNSEARVRADAKLFELTEGRVTFGTHTAAVVALPVTVGTARGGRREEACVRVCVCVWGGGGGRGGGGVGGGWGGGGGGGNGVVCVCACDSVTL